MVRPALALVVMGRVIIRVTGKDRVMDKDKDMGYKGYRDFKAYN